MNKKIEPAVQDHIFISMNHKVHIKLFNSSSSHDSKKPKIGYYHKRVSDSY